MAEITDEFQVCVHVQQDWAFEKYEKHRQASEDTQLPQLLRGFNWWISVREPRERPMKSARLESARQDSSAKRQIAHFLESG